MLQKNKKHHVKTIFRNAKKIGSSNLQGEYSITYSYIFMWNIHANYM